MQRARNSSNGLSYVFHFHLHAKKGTLLDFVSTETRHLLESDFQAVRKEIALGIVETTARERRRFLAAWELYLSNRAPEIDLSLSD